RFDSCQLDRARARREELPPPDRTDPLVQRVGRVTEAANAAPSPFPRLFPVVWSRGDAPAEWSDDVPLRDHVTIVASDRGVRVALEEWAARHPASDDETCVAIDPVALEFRGYVVDPRPILFLANLASRRGAAAEPLHVFA